MLVCNGVNVGTEKASYAHMHGIPVVSADWLWACIESGTKQPFDDYTINTSQHMTKNSVSSRTREIRADDSVRRSVHLKQLASRFPMSVARPSSGSSMHSFLCQLRMQLFGKTRHLDVLTELSPLTASLEESPPIPTGSIRNLRQTRNLASHQLDQALLSKAIQKKTITPFGRTM